MGEADKEGPNFIIVPRMTDREAVSLLLSRFPAMRDLPCGVEDCLDLSTVVYGSFTSEVLRRSDDSALLESVVQFINEIAESKDRLLRNLLDDCLLDGIASSPDVAGKISGALSEKARELLRNVERNFYHRGNEQPEKT